jgi:hypothetical protein
MNVHLQWLVSCAVLIHAAPGAYSGSTFAAHCDRLRAISRVCSCEVGAPTWLLTTGQNTRLPIQGGAAAAEARSSHTSTSRGALVLRRQKGGQSVSRLWQGGLGAVAAEGWSER